MFVALAALGAVLLIGGTIAYSQDKAFFRGIFGTPEYKTVSTEVFTSPTNWKTCESIPKTVTVKNESSAPVVVRAKYEEDWIASDRTTHLPLKDSATGLTMAIINRGNVSKWILNEADGYYYYYQPLQPGETTATFLESVTLNCDANLNASVTNTCTTQDGQTVCTSSSKSEYAEATYTLRVVTNTIQNNAAAEEWGYGEQQTASEATLLRGDAIAARIGDNTNIVRVDALPEDFPSAGAALLGDDITTGGMRASTETSTEPIYMWTVDTCANWGEADCSSYAENTVYWYSAAAKLYYNPNMEGFLSSGGAKLNSEAMSFYSLFDASKITTLDRAFNGLDRNDFNWLSNWDVSGVKTMNYAFSRTRLQNLTAFSSWRLKSLESMVGTFDNNSQLATLDGAQNWFNEGVSLTSLNSTFASDTTLADISAIASWDVSKVTDFSSMFKEDSALTSISALNAWNMSSATTISGMFLRCAAITDGDSVSAWGEKFGESVNMSGAFTGVEKKPEWYTGI